MASPFIFKQFSLEQGRSAFKLGTDSVLLGAWLPSGKYLKILDAGGGTGILSLMMAQRFELASILSIEKDHDSYIDMTNNFAHSKWDQRLSGIYSDILEWSNQHEKEKFELIISNPPYFTNNLQNPDSRKANARHTRELNATSLASLVKKHISPKGAFACILPSLEFEKWKEVMEENNLHLTHICNIRSFEHTDIVRKAGIFSLNKNILKEEDHFIYNNDKSRSDWYATITSPFYIK